MGFHEDDRIRRKNSGLEENDKKQYNLILEGSVSLNEILKAIDATKLKVILGDRSQIIIKK
jgi:hypothetical protein